MRHGTAPRAASRLITALIALTAAAILIPPPQAHADNAKTAQTSPDDNIEISVPTSVPCLVKADGTIIAPTAETWKIRNDSPQPVTLDTAVADTITPGTSITAKSQPTTLYEDDTQDGKGSYTISIDDTGNETRTEGGTDEHPVQIAPGESLGFDWDVQLPTHLLNCAPPQPITVADISMTFKTIRKTAFAVYSNTDKSLDFYKRIRIPQVGETLNGKTVTNIYTGFEDNRYTSPSSSADNWKPDAINNTPWFSHHLDIATVSVIDNGIRPQYLDRWFQNFHNCKTFDLDKLDMSSCVSINTAFSYCTSATGISISSWNVSHVNDFTQVFLNCTSLGTLDLSGWNTSSAQIFHSTFNRCGNLQNILIGSKWNFSHVWQCRYMFWGCAALTLDCSEWDVSGIKPGRPNESPTPLETSWHYCFNYNAPGVILPKPWQAGAFAIYSTDDDSLDFYKRSNCELPSTGSTFNGKVASAVYTGFENSSYDFVATESSKYDLTNTPWFSHLADIKTVCVVDNGITPTSMNVWFADMISLESVELSKLDTSRCVSMLDTFFRNSDLTSLDLSNWDVSNVHNFSCMFQGCYSLRTIDLRNWKAHPEKTGLFGMFFECSSLESIDLSGFDLSNTISANKMFGRCFNLSKISFSSKWKWLVFDDGEGTNSLLPSPSAEYIDGADGKWYSITTSKGYAPADIPIGKADTYVASRKLLSKVAFAVYSADDYSLDFYKKPRYLMPISGSVFNGKHVTEIYPDIEDYNFDISGGRGDGNAPWWSHRTDIISVKVVDSIKPKNMTGWFYWFINVTSIDLGPIDTSENTSLFGTFDRCFKLQTIDVSMMNTSKVRSMGCAFYGDGELTRLDISNWNISNVNDFSYMFIDCKKLGVLNMPPSPKFSSQIDFIGYMFLHCENLNLDCSDWNVPVSADHPRFNDGAPGVILPKVWQTTTSAVYSSNETKRLTSINS